VGQTGPGGGVIFYVASSTFSCGPTLNLTCKYLEYSPKGWSGSNTDPGGAFSGALITQVPQGTSSAIGAGYQNTLNIIAQGSSSTTAPGRAQSYRGGGLSDWYLPSELEWSALYNYINLDSAPGNEYTTDFNTRYFWSSTETTSSTSSGRVIDLYSGAISDSGKNNIGYAIRPIRAFG
jgi:hypothetical protein